jgi:hypothetical protein
LKISFSTLGCPRWSWDEIVVMAKDLGYDGIEVRGIGSEIYIPFAKPFLPENIERTKNRLVKLGLEIPCLTSSCNLSDKSNIHKVIKEGTVDIEIIQSNINIDLSDSKSSLFPATNTQLEKFIKTMKELKSDKKITSSQLYKLSNASRIIDIKDNPKEFQLFYLYQSSKTSPKYTYYVSKLFDEEVFQEEDVCFCGLIQRRNDPEGKIEYISPWNDIVLLWDAIGGE